MMVVVPPASAPVWVELFGTDCGGGTVAGDGMPEDGWEPVAGTEVGGGTLETGGCGGVCWELSEVCTPNAALSSNRTKIKCKTAEERSFRRCIVSRLGIDA